MKKTYVFLLFTIFMFIISCNKPTTSPTGPSSEVINGITYYDPATAETKEYYIRRTDWSIGNDIEVKSKFKKLAESQHTILYAEDGQNVTREHISSFLTKFEEYYPKEIEIYGEPSDLDQNGKVIFLMAALNTNKSPNDPSKGGYFNPLDLVIGKNGAVGEYLHVDTDRSDLNYIVGVMMHEFQHLINANVNREKAMDIWLNEALSESTSHIFSESLVNERKDTLIKVPYYSFYSWNFKYNTGGNIFDSKAILMSYASSSMFMKWLDIKTGGNYNIYKEIAHSDPSLTSEQRLLNITSKNGLGDNMDDLMLNWVNGLSKGEVAGLDIAAIDPNSQDVSINGKIALVPKALIVYDTASLQGIDKTKTIALNGQNWNGYSAIINTANNDTVGVVDQANIIELNLPQVNGLESSAKYKSVDFDLLKGNYIEVNTK